MSTAAPSAQPAEGSTTFIPTAEQEELGRMCRRFLDKRAPVHEARRLMGGEGFDRSVWVQLAEGLGLQGLLVPEAHGGAGAGMADLAVAVEELGRVLYSGPYLASAVLATSALVASGDETALAELAPGLVSGQRLGSFVLADRPTAEPSAVSVLASLSPDAGWTLSGSASYVLHGMDADFFVVAARAPGGCALFLVDAVAEGLARRRLPVLDETQPLAALSLQDVSARLLGAPESGPGALAETIERGALALAAATLGTGAGALDLTLEYAKQREQFDRPIGSFQAIKHRFADMLLELELARSAVTYATRAVDGGTEDAARAVHVAKAQCSDACFHICAESIQIHGGVGFTWEHDAHLYFKRARADAALFGSADWHREQVLAGLGF